MHPRHHATRIPRHVQLSRLIPSQTRQIATRRVQQKSPRPALAALRQRPHSPANKIAKYIRSGERGHFRSVVHMPANHCLVSLRSVIIKDRIRQRFAGLCARRGERMCTFPDTPSHIRAALLRRQHIHFFKTILPHVTNPQISVCAVEGKPE